MGLATRILPTTEMVKDPLSLGETEDQREAEMLAGLHAELYASPITRALSLSAGRVNAQLMMRLERNPGGLNFISTRMIGLSAMLREALNGNVFDATVIDMKAGLSPRGALLAEVLPMLTVIEVDSPDMIDEKQYRLGMMRAGLPKNLQWIATDASNTTFDHVLEPGSAHAVIAEAVNGQLTPDEMQQLAHNVYEALTPDGAYIFDVPLSDGMVEARSTTRIQGMFPAGLPGEVSDAGEIYGWLRDASFSTVDVRRPSELAEELGLALPIIDSALFVLARK